MLPTPPARKEVAVLFVGCSLGAVFNHHPSAPTSYNPSRLGTSISEAGVSYLNITVVIEQYIFQLQVPVDQHHSEMRRHGGN